MKKGISISAMSSMAKKAALGVMLFSSMALHASNPIKTTTVGTPIQTEVVSREGADALKAITFPGFQQNPIVPTVHNKKLDENFLKFCNTPEEKKMVTEFIDNIYKENGSYLGSATIQQNIDLNMFLEFLDGNIEILKMFEGDYRITDNSQVLGSYYEVAKRAYNYSPKTKEQLENLKNNIGEWINQNYFGIYKDALIFDHQPNYDEIMNSMQNFIKSNTLELAPDKPMFTNVKFKEIESDKNYTNQDYMDLIAINMHNMNIELFLNILRLYYNSVYDKNIYRQFDAYMQAAAPKLDI